jgi:hypothetical protein
MNVPPARPGEIWVEGSTLATVLDWAKIDPITPPHKVRVIDPDGHQSVVPLDGHPKEKLEQIKIKHGTRVIVPFDRCFGFRSNARQLVTET